MTIGKASKKCKGLPRKQFLSCISREMRKSKNIVKRNRQMMSDSIKNWKHITSIHYMRKKSPRLKQIDIIYDKKRKIYMVFDNGKLIGKRRKLKGVVSAESLAKQHIFSR